MSNFQSYLVLGKSGIRKKTAEVLKLKGLSTITPSPDFFTISPQKTSISISEIRNLKSHIFQKPFSLPYKYVIIEDSQKLTQEAQNALLKILEEPPKSAIIILEASDKFSLLPTILSRVVTLEATESLKPKQQKQSILDSDSKIELLSQITQVDNPQEWLDNQMVILAEKLEGAIKNKSDTQKITRTLKLCAQAKKMIAANIKPRFALSNLVFLIQL